MISNSNETRDFNSESVSTLNMDNDPAVITLEDAIMELVGNEDDDGCEPEIKYKKVHSGEP